MHNMYSEGKANIKHYDKAFLNPKGKLSRDISVAYMAVLADKDSNALDATSATGIRGIRYIKEANIGKVTFLDINIDAYNTLMQNIRFNKVKRHAIAYSTSIQEFANLKGDKYDFIDLDPFGSAAPNIQDLLKVSKDGTRLMVTSTDTAVLCGAQEKACMRIYLARPMHNELCYEAGIRVLIGYIARLAGQFNYGIEVEASFSYLHYMRVFIRLVHGAAYAYKSISQLGYATYCNKCGNRNLDERAFPEKKCTLCSSDLYIAGPLWTGSIYNHSIISNISKHMKENGYDKDAINFIGLMDSELDTPLYYSIPRLTKMMGIAAVSPLRVIECLIKHGYRASKTHMDIHAIRTDAGIDAVKKCTLECLKSAAIKKNENKQV
jgi:N2,N2-dimethylguanosine tRNA methyltransferase